MKSYVAYLRVSTHKQGQSGLGLAAQRAAVGTFTPAAHLLGEFVEVESGKRNERPQLQAAMALAKATGATLLIAKLDRLSRNAGFIFALRDTGVDFVCCDMPDANTLTVGIFAVLAQHERELISQRTKAALAAKKAQGAQLGTPANLTPAATQKGRDGARRWRTPTNIMSGRPRTSCCCTRKALTTPRLRCGSMPCAFSPAPARCFAPSKSSACTCRRRSLPPVIFC